MKPKHLHLVAANVSISIVVLCAAGSPGADYTVRVVNPAVTNWMILPDGPLPPVCKPAVDIELSACRGEYEPASFVVIATQPLEQVGIEVGPLTGPGGQWPTHAVDVRVVKDYYWPRDWGIVTSPGIAVPSLLVHDERFLTIEPDPSDEEPGRLKNVAVGELADTEELQPVEISQRKQFWVTVHVPEDARPGSYTTTLRVVPQNAAPTEFTLRLQVHPFELLAPMLEYSIYYPANLYRSYSRQNRLSFSDITVQQAVAEFKNMLDHGVTNPNIYAEPTRGPHGTIDFSRLDHVLDLRESIGMRPKSLYLIRSPAIFSDRQLTVEERLRSQHGVAATLQWATSRGYEEVFFMAGDEYSGDRLRGERDSMVAVHEAGGKVGASCFLDFFDLAGDLIDRPVLLNTAPDVLFERARGMQPREFLEQLPELASLASFETMLSAPNYRKAIDGVHRQGKKIFVYMNPTGGVPFPDLHRRNQGLGLWRVGFDGTMNWAYTHITYGPDGTHPRATVREEQNMSLGIVFRTDSGPPLDTLAWEGFREGVDDVRYLTTLYAALRDAAGRFRDEPLIAKTHQWLSTIDVAHGNLDAIRREMTRRIIALQDLGYQE